MVQEKIIDWTDPEVRKEFEEEIKRWLVFSSNYQYCQVRNINILNRVCRELTRLSRSKHTLVNILTIGQTEHPYMTPYFYTTENSI